MTRTTAIDILSGNTAFDRYLKSQRAFDLALGIRGRSGHESIAKSADAMDLITKPVLSGSPKGLPIDRGIGAASIGVSAASVTKFIGSKPFGSDLAGLVTINQSARAASNWKQLTKKQSPYVLGGLASVSQSFAMTQFAEQYRAYLSESPAMKMLGMSVAQQIGRNFNAGLMPASTIRALKGYESSLVAARAATILPDLKVDLSFLADSATASPLDEPGAAADAALAVADELHIEVDDTLQLQLLRAVEKLQIMVSELQSEGDNQRRRTDAQFFLALLVALVTYLYPRR